MSGKGLVRKRFYFYNNYSLGRVSQATGARLYIKSLKIWLDFLVTGDSMLLI
jgi:hypothetical protein